MDYREAGVDVEAGRAFVRRIRNLVHSTHRPRSNRWTGWFCGCFQLPGVQGTGFGFSGVVQAKTCQVLNCHNTVGIDLVAMCVNDVLTAGAELFFWIIWRLVS